MKEFLIGIAALAADRAGKAWAEKTLDEYGEKRPVLKGRLFLYRIKNRGSAGGYLKGKTELLSCLSAAAIGGCFVHMAMLLKTGVMPVVRIGESFVIGGGLGNLIDRIRKGGVTDFIAIRHKDGRIGKYVYNIADMAIAIGAVLIIIGELIHKD